MELECDLSKINNEELLRKMWQQSEDVNRKKEIRSQLYKLRESRLKDLYQGDIMADNSAAGFGKDPLVTSHGDALADQSFQSLKSKEIRDSLSPTEMRFQSMTLNNPNTTGWNVQSAKEVSPDGKGFRAETIATTDGVESVNGGIAEFKGRNEQLSSAHHEGDDKNFVKKAMETSNSHLQEKVVTGDENSLRTEVRTSSTKSSSSSQVIQSSTNVEYENDFPVDQQPHPQKYLMDTNRLNQQDFQQRQQQEQQRLIEEQRIYEQQLQQQQQRHNQQEHRITEQVSKTRQNTEQKNISQNIQTQETHEQNKHYVDMDKASPEYQQHVQHLMKQPGEIISNTVEYPKPNVKMITTVKRLPDGTIVRNKRYETEEKTPTTPSTRSTSTPLNQTQPRRDSQQTPSKNHQPDSSPHSRSSHDMVDSSSTARYVQDTHTDDMETKFSSVKSSSSKFSTESTSEIIQEFDEHHPQGGPSSRPKPRTNDFSTHGFPSVRADKPTQEYSSERPHTAFPTQTVPSGPNAAVVPRYTDDTDNITERRVNTKDGEVIIVSSEKKHNFKTSTNSERIVETEQIIHNDQPNQQIPNRKTQDFSTHGFPSVRAPSSQQQNKFSTEKQMQPHEQDFPLDKLPPGTRIITNPRVPHGEEEVVLVSSQKSHTAKHSTNMERIIEHDITTEDETRNLPHIKPNKDNISSSHYTVTTPGEQIPQGGHPSSPKKYIYANNPTQEFPSVRTPGYVGADKRESYYDQPSETRTHPSDDYATQGYPSVGAPTRPAAGLPSSHKQHQSSPRKSPSQDYSTQGFPSVRSASKTTPTHGYPSNVGARPNETTEQSRSTSNSKPPARTSSPNKYKTTNTNVSETTERVIRREKEVDSAHRAFAASLRSSSPLDHTDYHSRHTPRSSVSSTRTFRRDIREGSHESAPSETSRISTTTITRNTPPRAVGGRTVVTKTFTTKTSPGSNDSLNVTSPRATKSPSPGKTVSTTTNTNRTLTSRDVPKVTDNQHTRITSNKIDTFFPINEPPLTSSITKHKFSDNHKQPHKKTINNNSKNNIKSKAAKTDFVNNASAGLKEVIEAPFLKKNYYKLGPSDHAQAQMNSTTTHSLKSPQIDENSPTKKPSSQPAPSSRSSTPSFNNRKPSSASVMTDDYDDDKINKTSPFSSPSSRSRTPQKIVPSKDNDKPQDDDRQMPRQPDNDERRTVNSEITFEKPENEPLQPRRTNYDQPNVEWIIVDDHDQDNDDSDSFAPEMVDANLNVKRTTTKLISQEKHNPLATQRKTKPTTTTQTIITTKKMHTIPAKTPTKPNDKSPLKSRPFDSKTPQSTKTNKPLTDSKSPVRIILKTPTKTVDHKPATKGLKSTLPSYAAPLRKPLPKSTTHQETTSTSRKTLKTSQVLKEKTSKLIEAEKSKERKTKPQTSDERQPSNIERKKTNMVTKTSGKHVRGYEPHEPEQIESHPRQTIPLQPEDHDDDIAYRKPQYSDDEPYENIPIDVSYEPQKLYNTEPLTKPQEEDDIFFTPQPDSPEFETPINTFKESNNSLPGKPYDTDRPKQKSPAVRKPPSPGFQKLQSTFDESSPHFGKPFISHDDEPYQNSSVEQEPQKFIEEHIRMEETSQHFYPDRQVPKQANDQPIHQIPGIKRPQEHETNFTQPLQRKPDDCVEPKTKNTPSFEPQEGLPIKNLKIMQEDNTFISKIYHEEMPEKEIPENKPNIKTNERPEQPTEGKPRTPYYRKPFETDEEPGTTGGEPLETVVTSKKTVAKHIQKFETNFLKNNTQTPKKLPKTPLKPVKGRPATEEPSGTEEDKQFDNITEFYINSKQKNVINENFVSKIAEEPKTPGTKSPQRVISPTRNQKKPDETFGRRPQSPEKHISPKGSQPGPKEPAGKQPEEPQSVDLKPLRRVTSPSRKQNKPEEPFGSRPQSPNKHVSPNRDYPGQQVSKHPEQPQKLGSKTNKRVVSPARTPKNVEEPFGKRPLSPNKHVSPQRSQNLTNDVETFTTLTTKVVKENITQEIENEYPTFENEYKPLSHKPNDEETFTETCKFAINSTQKQPIKEEQINEFIKPLHPGRKSPTKLPTREGSPTKSQNLPEKRAQSPNKHVSPTRPQKKCVTDDEKLFRETTRHTEVIRENASRKVKDNEEPEENRSLKNPKGPKYYPKQTSDTEEEDTITETRECVINLTKKQKVTEQKYQNLKETQQKDTKSPLKDTSPTRNQRKPVEKQAVHRPVQARPESPIKHISPTRAQKKPEDNETFTTSITTKKAVKEQRIEADNDEKYQQIKKFPKDNKSPTREPLKKTPKSPSKPLSPTRNPEDEETFKAPLTVTKAVSEKPKERVPAQQYPNQITQYRKGEKPEYEPKEKPSDDEEDKKCLETYENFKSSKIYKVTGEVIQEPESPKTSQKYQSSLNENAFIETTVTENFKMEVEQDDETFITSKTQLGNKKQNQEFDEPNKPDRDVSLWQKLPEEPKISQPTIQTQRPVQKQVEDDGIKATNEKTTEHVLEEPFGEKPKKFKTSPLKPTETDGDEKRSQTTELVFKTTYKQRYPDSSKQDKKPHHVAPEFEITDEKETFAHTSDFIRNTSEKLIETEQKLFETQRSLGPKEQKPMSSPTERQQPLANSPSLKIGKPKYLTEDDKTFRKSLRTIEIVTKQKDHKPDHVKPTDTDEEETTSETEDLLIETCKTHNVIAKSFIPEKVKENISPTPVKPEKPETSERQTLPKDVENIQPQNKRPFEAPLEPRIPKKVNKRPTDFSEQFIESERDRKETPDGAFISKTTEPSTPTSPTFRKKGTGRSDTFEERCRQILGMDNYGDTQGSYKIQPATEMEEEKFTVTKELRGITEDATKNTAVFQVKIEDCDEDDEPFSINSEKKTLHRQMHTTEENNGEPVKEQPKIPDNKPKSKAPKEVKGPKESNTTTYEKNVDQTLNKTISLQTKTLKDENEPSDKASTAEPDAKNPKNMFEPREDFNRSEFEQIITDTTKVHGKSPDKKNQSKDKPEKKPTKPNSRKSSDIFEPQGDNNGEYEQTITETTTVHKKLPRGKKEEIVQPHSSRPKDTFEPQRDNKHGFEQIITETTVARKKSPKNKPISETELYSSEPETDEKKFVQETQTTEIKITEKSSPLATPRSISPTKSTSSPRSLSPTKVTPTKDLPKRKPSKDLLEPKSNRKSPQKLDEDTTSIKDRLRSSTRKSKSPGKLDQVDGSDSSPEHSPTRFTERRRSSNISVTTEIIIEHTDSDTPYKKENSPTIVRKPQDSVYKDIIDSTVLPEKLTRRMPVTERKESAPVHRVTSKDKDTKMSRSTSENLIKIKSTEPHSVTPKTPIRTIDHRRPNKCFATKSINLSATDRLINSGDMENVIIDIQHAKSSREPSPDKIIPTPVPAHLDTGKPRYPDVVQEPEDDRPKRKPQVKNIPIFEEENNSYIGCHITEINLERNQKTTYDSLDYEEQILNNPVVEAPSSLDYISLDKPSDDESLLTVHEKVNKYQNITQKVNKADIENEENVYCSIKLGPSAPQKSPQLVRTISRHISRQNEPDNNNEVNKDDYPLTTQHEDHEECLLNNKKLTKEFKVSHHEKTTETTNKTAEKYQQPEEYVDDHHHDDDELIPHTATHTTIIEERRQKNILSRPSVFESRNKTPTTIATKTALKCNKSPVEDTEKLRPDNKSRTKPTSAVTNTTTTTTTFNATSDKPKQFLPQHKNTDIDYEFRGNNVETGVKNNISKQTKVYNSSNTSSDSKTNDLKKLNTTSNKKPEKHMPVRLTPSQNTDEYYLSADDDEMIVTLEETTTDIDIESQVVNEDLNKKTVSRKIPLHKKQPTTHSSTNSSPSDQLVEAKQKKEHLVKLTDNKPLISNTVTTTTSIKTYETIERADDIDETVLEPTTKKSPTQTHTKPTKMSTTATDSVAAKRSLFENNNHNNNGTTKRTPLASPLSGRRPSYMDHTKSSLEHTRKDSLEINKTNYSRKPSQTEEEVTGFERNSMVKFDVPQGKRVTTPRAASITEDINVEEIFDVDILEKLLETVQSYEIRRRVRAQIRLIKKNQKNEALSTSTTEVTTKTVKSSKVENEEPDNVTTTTRKSRPDEKSLSQKSQTKKEYIFEETYHPTTRRTPKPNHYPYEEEEKPTVRKPARNKSPESPKCSRSVEHERHFSPDKQKHTELAKEHDSTHTTKQHYYYKDEHEREEFQEIRHETSPSRKSPSPNRKPHSSNSSPERRYVSPEPHSSLKNNQERSRSPKTKPAQSNRVTSSRSPDIKTSTSTIRKSSASYEQQESVMSSSNKQQTKHSSSITKTKTEEKTPVWADRKNILKTPSSTTPKKPSSSTIDSKAGFKKTVKSTTSQKMTSNKSSSLMDDDCITSSYGIGPTDENGLPLFGIRALKKKKPTVEPSETTEEVTGYVVEEKYYSDNKTKPTLERKEFIYSTNPEELKKLKKQVQVSGKRTSLKDVDIKESRQAALIPKATPALRSSPEDDFLDSTTKYGRRGSVKEISEKFIQKEASSSVTEKSNNYPKAGLILRTNSRKSSRDMESENDSYESFKTTRVQQHTSSALADSDDNQYEYEVEEVASRHSGRFITESESECDSIKTQREFKKVTSSSSSSMATRSFLNSQGEEKVVTNVSDCLERMRNADNVVEEGDTAEDQEARALLNKFLGASIIMKGVESSLPATNRPTKIITTTTTSSSLNDDDNDGDNNAKHEVKSTRITKTIRSGSSSTPVTYTTCDIEEIWDEEILKELLEQARTYEERRKIRSRLRELMADREEKKKSPKGEEKEVKTAAEEAAGVTKEEEESSASEYEEIIEEVTDYSEAESEADDKQNKKIVVSGVSQEKEETCEAVVARTEEKSVTVTAKQTNSLTPQEEQIEQSKTVTVEEIVEEYDDKTDSSDKGESLMPMVHDKKQKTLQTMPRENVVHGNPPTNSKKLKSSQENMTNKSKTTSTEPASSQNQIATVQTAGRADSTLTSNRNNSNKKIINSNVSISSSGSLGGNTVVVGSSDSPRQVERLGVPQKEDSGTESGEDLRLIAAGLRDQLQIQNDSNIIEDVTCALSRLENSLKEGRDISIDTEKRKALLALVARLRAGLTSPEKLAEIAAAMSELDGNEGCYGETSSPEADAHRSNRSRFGKRKNRVSRHTVGVSREELADARRYMEDMLLMSNISQSTTPDANSMPNNTPPQWYPLEKNASSGAILTPSVTPVLQRPKQFVPEEKSNAASTNRLLVNNGKRRPLSGEFSVSFENSESEEAKASAPGEKPDILDNCSKGSRFINKKHLMKRANTIDLAKTHKYNTEHDTDSDAEDKGTNSGLKRAVQVSVKKRVQNVVPPFEPKTENDRKFLAFINKQSDKPGLGWTSSRSVSNWTNKFGSIKNTFEGGLVSKPPLAPHHVSSNIKIQQTSKLFSQTATNNQAANYISNQQIALRLQREAERQAEERRRKLEKEHLEYERRERDKLERQRQQRERQERERLEREHFERQRREQDQITAAQHAAFLRDQDQSALAQQTVNTINMPQPIPINEFKHAPQSVFRPIESGDTPSKPIYKPIPQFARNTNNWQPLNSVPARSQLNLSTSPGQYGNTRPDNSFITSPPPSSRSPIALPWASKPTVDSSSFRSKAHRFEERSKYDHINNTSPFIQRHNSLRSANGNYIPDDFRKRPSLPNTFEPYSITPQLSTPHNSLAYLPPPQNISFTYSSLKPKTTYQSYPCLPLAVASNLNENQRPREDSLTDPQSVPLVLTSANPSYCPVSQPPTQIQQQQSIQPRLQRQFDLVSPCDSAPTSPSLYTVQQTDCTDDDFESDNNLLEYHAVSRVMRKPQSQTAVTVGRRTGHVSDDELYGKNSRAAKNLLSTMKSIGNPNSITRPKAAPTKRPEAVTSPRTCLSPDGRSYQAPIVEPIFPEINKFEANRSPLYSNESAQKIPASTYQHPAESNQVGMYKSMENLNRSTSKTQSNFSRHLHKQQQQETNLKPYVSETQTSYVVTYPIEDHTDDEEFQRVSQKKIIPPNSLDITRHRHISENSTGSSTTTSMSFSQNLPSPNTSWTSNPIVQKEGEYNSYQNKPTTYQNSKQGLATSVVEPTYQKTSGNSNISHNYKTDIEASSTVGSTNNGSATKTQTSRSAYETNTQKQLQQNQISKQLSENYHKPTYTPKPANYTQQNTSKIVTSSSSTQEKKSVVSMRSMEQPIINPKQSNISQEMLKRLDQQRERLSNEERRKSLGNTIDFQMEKQTRYETTQNSQVYKSSAPADTPDIVKSSLPKDETQPILKKFGPPQRHHYMPNSYQSPNTKMTSSSVVATNSYSTNVKGKSLQSSTQQTLVKKSQQIFSNNTKPTVMETPATPQPNDDYIPRNIVYNNIHAFSSMTRRQEEESDVNMEHHHAVRPSKLSKSDSWNQIMMLQKQNAPANTMKYNQSPTNELRRTKSGHTLAVPKMFEAAMTKTDISEKQKTVAAYFSGQKSPIQHDTVVEQQQQKYQQQITKRSVINRTKTSEKVSAASRKSLGSNLPIVPGGLQRSATMPHIAIANVNLLDESNVEDAFEQLMMEQKQQKSTSSTTEKTETKEEDGALVTTTTKVTTRTVTGSAAKPVTPFAKFKQLDKENSKQPAKSPTTPTTTGGGSSTASPTSGNQPIFKFTDPALNAKAATVKEQLLQWCQSKTQEYENIEITNFSTSWNNGLAFCALIHHFLPDAFDYSQLTPKNRRKNFELAFTVADEKAGIAPLLDVEDMVVMQRPDWKCVFVYVQSIYRRFRNCQ